MNKVVEYVIRAKDATGAAIKSALGRVRSLAAGTAGNLANIQAGLSMAMNAVRTFASAFSKSIAEAFRFEKALTDFKVLLGSIDAAKAHVADLKSFAASTPLTFGDLSRASKLLLSFGSSVDEVMPSLKTLGDIALGDAQRFQGLALVFAQVKSQGKLMGQDLIQMVNQGFNPLTVISKETGRSMGELKDMMADGQISFQMVAEAMRIATGEGGLFNNAMEEASKTGEGLVSTLSDNWTDAVRTFGEAFADSAKGGVAALTEKIRQLIDDGTIASWAEKASEMIGDLIESIQGLYDKMHEVGDEDPQDRFDRSRGAKGNLLTFLGNAWAGLGSIGAGINGWLTGSDLTFGESQLAYMAKHGYGSEADRAARMLNESLRSRGYWDGDIDIRDGGEPEPQRQASAAEQAAHPAADTTGEPGQSLTEMLDAADEKEKARAAEAAKKAEEAKVAAEKKAAEAEERERLRIEKEIAAERERLRKAEMEAYRRELTAANESALAADSAAQARLSAAQSASQRAWGWYRDRDSLAAQLEEERADAAAQARFEKDFAKLRQRSDWRTAASYGSGGMRALSLDEEATRRVALAREEERAAEEYARQTAEECRRSADALEALQTTICGEG